MSRRIRRMLSAFMLAPALALGVSANALTLPNPQQLQSLLRTTPQTVRVIEPHLSTAGSEVIRSYSGWPAARVLDELLGSSWRTAGVDVEFRALDGYVARIPSERFQMHQAHITFAHVGHSEFTVDNLQQNEKKVPLGPYYLVWENIGQPELIAEGGAYWPYQVQQIQVSQARKDAMLPQGLPPDLVPVAAQAQKHCLSCHQVNGYGGDKWPGNLAQQARSYTQADFVRWVTEPSNVKPGTAMPGLPMAMPIDARRELAHKLYNYLTQVTVAASKP